MIIPEDPQGPSRPPRVPKVLPIVDASNLPRPLTDAKKAPHFLSEFNVNECCDFRAIPDPPTPEPRSRRRHSMLPTKEEEEEEEGNVTNSKRSRKSLCHVPSPMEQREESSPPPMHVQQRICLDDDDTRAKRRKKRQSMELPRDLVRGITPCTDPVPPSFVGNLQDMKDLQALVRGYCKMPRDLRATSQQARLIEESTGYPLLQPVIHDDPQSHANRRAVLSKMAPIIEEIDRRRAEDTAKWEYETGCRVERSKSGKYRYISLETNTKVGSQEYKRRYMGVISRESSLRLFKARQWKEKLLASNDSQEDFEPLPMDAPLVTDASSDMEDDTFSTTHELDLDLNDILESSRDTFNEDNHMEICDVSASLDMGENDSSMYSHSRTDRMSQSMGGCTKEMFDDAADKDDLEQELAFQPPPTTNHTKTVPKSVTPTELEILPLPDREEASSDPDVARAERLLWSRIDSALQEYSEEVLRIRKSRQSC